MAIFFFCGIGGIGMSAIALYLQKNGNAVCGSDRAFDRGENAPMRRCLEKSGIRIFPQDGSGVSARINTFVVSTAIEETVPDVKQARRHALAIRRRAELLADILRAHNGIAIAGTSGKTTVTAMTAHIFYVCGKDPTMINGGISLNRYRRQAPSNLLLGRGEECIVEADESDGSIQLYTPDVAALTNISLDHKPLDEIRPLFEDFLNRTRRGIVINADCPETRKLRLTQQNIVSFSARGNQAAAVRATHIKAVRGGVRFKLNGLPVRLPLIGAYNVENALAAAGVGLHAGIPLAESMKALASFKGTRRRLQVIGTRKGVTVIDDYAHNPAKIEAALQALKEYSGRLFVIFQPHGFAPTRLMKDDFIRVLKAALTPQIHFIMPAIYYAGGTTVKDISSDDIIRPLKKAGARADYIPRRADIIPFLAQRLKAGDRVVVMGARDDTLTGFAKDILRAASEGK